MSKVLIATRKEGQNPVVNKKMKELLDCEFTELNAKNILALFAAQKSELVVIYLSKISSDEEIEVNKFLLNSGEIPVVLAGDRSELSRFFDKTPAHILRYIKTPILLSAYINEIQKVINKIEGKTANVEAAPEVADFTPPKHILVVDDDVVVLRTINNWLNECWTVSVAKSGAAALQFLAKTKPDLILLDYNMPVCDGLQTLQMIRAEENLKDIPVFFLTGVDDHEQVQKALSLKPQGYILKSNGAGYLISKIEAFL